MKICFLFPVLAAVMLVTWRAAADIPAKNEWGAETYVPSTKYKWGVETNQLCMAIRLDSDKNGIVVGEPFGLLISYLNTSTNDVFEIRDANGTICDLTYSFEIISPSGKVVPVITHEVASGLDRLLKPGQILNIKFKLSELCQFEEVGIYRIQAKKSLISQVRHQRFQVESQVLNVMVAAKK